VDGAFDTALSPDGKRIAVASLEGESAVFNVDTGEKAFALRGPDCCTWGVSWSPDGRYVAAASEDATRVWAAETGQLKHTLLGDNEFLSVEWSPNSSRLVTGDSLGIAKVWGIGVKGARELWSLSAQEMRSGILGVAFSPDGTKVMAGDIGISAVKIWDLRANGDAEGANLPLHGASEAEFMPDGRRVVTHRAYDRTATIWDLRTRDLRTIGPAPDGFEIYSLDVSQDGGAFAVGGDETNDGGAFGGEVARVWDSATGEELSRMRHEYDVPKVAFTPDGRHVLTVSWDDTAKIFDRAGRLIRVLRPGGETIAFEAEFSADGRLVALVAPYEEGARVTIWDWTREKIVRSMQVGRTINDIYGLAFDPSGPRIAMVSSEELAEIRDVASGNRVAVLHGPSGGITDVTFSPDGSSVAVANTDGTIRLFEAATGAQQFVLPSSGCSVGSVAFSPDGTKLASTSPCDGVRIWALDIDDLLEIARQEVGRSLTDEECRQYLHVDQCRGGRRTER
jgi:WD40 repeat protein